MARCAPSRERARCRAVARRSQRATQAELVGALAHEPDGVGDVLLVEHAKGIQYGIAFMQEAMATTIGQAGAMLLAVILFIFIFTEKTTFLFLNYFLVHN